MQRILSNREVNVWGALVGGACLVGGLLARYQRRDAARTSGRVVMMGRPRGLRFFLAREFARRGASVVITARDDEESEYARQSNLRRWGSAPQQVSAIRGDVRDVSDVERALPYSTSRFALTERLIDRVALKFGELGPAAIDGQ